MTLRQRLRPAPLALACLLAAPLAFAGCGEDAPDGPAPLAPEDSAFALVMADLHLAAARAETTGEPADSLRRAALALHGLDSTAYARRLRGATATPEAAAALSGAVSDALARRTLPVSP